VYEEERGRGGRIERERGIELSGIRYTVHIVYCFGTGDGPRVSSLKSGYVLLLLYGSIPDVTSVRGEN
jgi:hypothetical protein